CAERDAGVHACCFFEAEDGIRYDTRGAGGSTEASPTVAELGGLVRAQSCRPTDGDDAKRRRLEARQNPALPLSCPGLLSQSYPLFHRALARDPSSVCAPQSPR